MIDYIGMYHNNEPICTCVCETRYVTVIGDCSGYNYMPAADSSYSLSVLNLNIVFPSDLDTWLGFKQLGFVFYSYFV